MLPPLSTPPPPFTIVDYISPWGQFVLSLYRAEDSLTVYSNDATQFSGYVILFGMRINPHRPDKKFGSHCHWALLMCELLPCNYKHLFTRMTTKTESTLEWIVTLTLRVVIKPEHSESPDLQSESRYHVIRSVNLSSKMRIKIPFSNTGDEFS